VIVVTRRSLVAGPAADLLTIFGRQRGGLAQSQWRGATRVTKRCSSS